MKKMKTLFKRDFTEKHEVIIHNEVTEGCEWVLTGDGIATRKLDGTACLIKDGKLLVRYDTWEGNIGKSKKQRVGKPAKVRPNGSIACMEKPDSITGSFPCWVPIESFDMSVFTGLKPYVQAWKNVTEVLGDGTYELCGPSFQGNFDNFISGRFIRHGSIVLSNVPRDFEGIKDYLRVNNIEGIVFHRGNGEMCKIKRTDFGFDWGHSEARKGKR